MSNPCTPAPPAPSGAPSNWTDSVRPNCFDNIDRLGRWKGSQTVVLSGSDPSNCFESVAPGSLGAGSNPPPIYVLIHGWAPGYLTTVQNAKYNVRWWGRNASSGGVWTSDWAWSGVTIDGVTVNANGFLQSIVAFDQNAIVLAYSWLDDSATYSEWDPDEAYESEAYTHTNGVRLAYALVRAIAPSFWKQQGSLTLIGHSHGSRVATVAALSLQQNGLQPNGPNVVRLAILDSPDGESTLAHGAANLLGFYLELMDIANPGSWTPGDSGTFVDNYVSYFGVAYSGTGKVGNVVEVSLDPTPLSWDPATDHEYAAAWFGGAAAGAQGDHQTALGLAWPPMPPPYAPYSAGLAQTWANNEQWVLQSGAPGYIYAYYTQPLALSSTTPSSCVTGSPSGKLTFGPHGTSPGYCSFTGTYSLPTDNYGVAFDIEWPDAQTGDFLVVTIGVWEQSVYFVMDAQSIPGGGSTTVAINADMWGAVYDPTINIYFYTQNGTVSLSNFLAVQVPPPNDAVRLRRQAIVAERAARRVPSQGP